MAIYSDELSFEGKKIILTEAEVATDHLELKEWDPPGQGTKARNAMPASAFLDPAHKKYPYKVKRGGKWVVSRSGIMAAKKRAAQQGKTSLVAKADRIISANGFAKKK